MANDTAPIRRRRRPSSLALPPERRAGTLHSGPTTGVDNVAAWFRTAASRYGGRPADVRLSGSPSDVAVFFVRLRQRYGTDGLNPRGRAWTERIIHTRSVAERREMVEALRTAYRALPPAS